MYTNAPTMFTIGQQSIKHLNDALDYIETNLKYQYVVPNYAHAWGEDAHTEIDGLISKLRCTITIQNQAISVPVDDYDQSNALWQMIGEVLISDMLETDVDGYIKYNDDIVNPADRQLPPIYTFKMNYTASKSRLIEINGSPFEISITFKRTYTKT
jgi:hypothetical protein